MGGGAAYYGMEGMGGYQLLKVKQKDEKGQVVLAVFMSVMVMSLVAYMNLWLLLFPL